MSMSTSSSRVTKKFKNENFEKKELNIEQKEPSIKQEQSVEQLNTELNTEQKESKEQSAEQLNTEQHSDTEQKEQEAIVSNETNEKLEVLNEAKKLELNTLEKEVLKDEGIWIPIPSLPSNNKIYKSDNTVFYKKYTFQDFEAALPEMLPQQKFRTMLKGLKCTELSSILLLPFYDFVAASFIRKLEAQGADKKYIIPYKCMECNQIGTFEFSARDIKFDALNIDIPLKARLHSYPDIIFEFRPHTIGDAIFLMDEDVYYTKNEQDEYIVDVTGSPIIDKKSMLAVCCSNFDFNTSYSFFKNISFREDYDILLNIASKLRFGLKNVEFTCTQQKPKESYDEEEQKTIQDDINKNNSEKLDAIRDWKGNLPPILQALQQRENMCGNNISIDILGGDVLFLPFRESKDTLEYGILSS